MLALIYFGFVYGLYALAFFLTLADCVMAGPQNPWFESQPFQALL